MNTFNKQHTYYCVCCGEEIKPDEMSKKKMISLSYAALLGTPDTTIQNTPVYVTQEELEYLIDRRDENGRQYLKLEEYVNFAYNERNIKYLDKTKVKDAKEALNVFFGDLENDEDEDAEAVRLPGFSEIAVTQLIRNFRFDGFKCILDWKIDEKNGYYYQLYSREAHNTKHWVCANCGEEILQDAFDHQQLLVGFFGYPSAGKTCLIGSLCHTMIQMGGILRMPSRLQQEYRAQLADYQNGYAMSKTKPEVLLNANTFHPSILLGEVLWSFVDIAGEIYHDNKDDDFKKDALVQIPEFRMSLKCHFYILTVDQASINNGIIGTFRDYLEFAKNHNPRIKYGIPALLALTKVDEVQENEKARNLPHYCVTENYPLKYREELSIIRNKGFSGFVDTLASSNYVFATTCAPYGFVPLPADDPDKKIFISRDHKRKWIDDYKAKHQDVPDEFIPHPVYKAVDPRNIDLIIHWLNKYFGFESIICDTKNGRFDLSALSWMEPHFDDDIVKCITCMFCNPNECDREWHDTTGDSRAIRTIKQSLLRRRFANRNEKK